MQETPHSLSEVTNTERKRIQMWKMLAELLEACSPDAQGTDIQKTKKKHFNYTDYCVWCFTKPMHAFLLSFPTPLSFPLCVSCTFLDHQQGLAWRSSSWVSFSRMTSKRSQSADELQTKPREGLCGMSHTTSIHSPEADWVTEQCSGNITKTLLNFCLSLSLSACPFIFPSLSPLVCPLLSLPLSPHPSSHELEPAERATQIQQLLRPSLA